MRDGRRGLRFEPGRVIGRAWAAQRVLPLGSHCSWGLADAEFVRKGWGHPQLFSLAAI